eukprot:10673392-Lingulodinium_polyedra.AAC.1
MRPALARASWMPANNTWLSASWRARNLTAPGRIRRVRAVPVRRCCHAERIEVAFQVRRPMDAGAGGLPR